MTDIVERLRDQARARCSEYMSDPVNEHSPDVHPEEYLEWEAAAELIALRERAHYAEGTAQLAMKHRDAAERELETANANHRAMASQLADMGRKLDEAMEALKSLQPVADARQYWL